jgi:16S rRNA (cytosine1407-C5)-methyltransferase
MKEQAILPSGFADFYRSLLGSGADREIQSLLKGPSTKVIRVIPSRFDITRLKQLVDEFQVVLSGTSSVQTPPTPFFDDAFLVSNELASQLSLCTAFNEGKFYIQSVPSYLVIKLLPVEEAEYVLDVCASPGGKALHVYDRMNRERPVIVNEPAGARRLRLSSVLKLYGAEELPLLGLDGGLLCHFVINTIPLIILDAPCSGEAHIITQPQRRKEWTPRQTKMLAQRQLGLASAAVHALKPGGLLLYSTCAMSPYEDELLIHELLDRFEGALVPQPWSAEKPGIAVNPKAVYDPLTAVQDQQIDPRIVQNAWRFRPSDFGEPFFGILLKKTESTSPKKAVEPCPIQYERGRQKNNLRIVKVGPGKREFSVPAKWPELPNFPYLRLGK